MSSKIDIKAVLSDFEQINSSKLKRKTFNYQSLVDFLKFSNFNFRPAGQSVEKRTIYQVSLGTGSTPIILWSQMHGNEPSSTIALLKVLEYLTKIDNYISRKILSQLSILAIPMLNPDGAELRQRRNAWQIDLNRDALELLAPESQILHRSYLEFKPQWAFNLHDQEIYYGTSQSPEPTGLALLVPSAAPKVQAAQQRYEAMAVAGKIAHDLLCHINIAKYNDSYMPTAFGDWFSSQKVRTILVETGFLRLDSDRYWATNYAAVAILLGLFHIANQQFTQQQVDFYEDLPLNIKHKFFDYILKNVQVASHGQNLFTVDLGISRDRRNKEHFTDYDTDYLIFEIGDLRFAWAFETLECREKIKIDLKELKLYKIVNHLIERCS